MFVTVPQAFLDARPSDDPSVSISADGRYVAFATNARLAIGDTNDSTDIYVLDRATGSVTLETLDDRGRGFVQTPESPHISRGGRFLVYTVPAPVRSAVTAIRTAMLRDRHTAVATEVARAGQPPNGSARGVRISADGTVVVFASSATNLTDGPDANGAGDDVYSMDVKSKRIRRISLDSAGRQAAVGASFAPSVSADGRYVSFSSTAALDGPVPVNERGRPQVNVYVRDVVLGVTRRISLTRERGPLNGPSYDSAISGDGRYVAFVSDAADLVRGDDNRAPDVFLYDRITGAIELISRGESGRSANGGSSHPAISHDGAVIAFQSDASDLTCSRRCSVEQRDINLVSDIFVYDRRSRDMRRASMGRTSWAEPSIGPALDGSGSVLAFSSRHPIDAQDDRDDYDLFIRLQPTPSATTPGRPAAPDTASQTSRASGRR